MASINGLEAETGDEEATALFVNQDNAINKCIFKRGNNAHVMGA